MIVIGASLIALGLVGAAWVFRNTPALVAECPTDALLRDRMRMSVIATLKSGEAFHGVLFDVDDRSLVLREAAAVSNVGSRTRVPVDGELLLARADVEYLQRP